MSDNSEIVKALRAPMLGVAALKKSSRSPNTLELAADLIEALQADRAHAAVQLQNAMVTMEDKGWWRNDAGYLTDAALWIEQAIKDCSTKGGAS